MWSFLHFFGWVLCTHLHVCIFVCTVCVLLACIRLHLCFWACFLVSAVCLQEYSLLYEEATFFQLAPLKTELERWRAEQERRDVSRDCECVVVHVTPELGERISVSASRALMEEIFPEVTDIVYSSMNASWNQDPTHVLRFPLNGYCHLTSVQVHNILWATLVYILSTCQMLEWDH